MTTIEIHDPYFEREPPEVRTDQALQAWTMLDRGYPIEAVEMVLMAGARMYE